MSGLATLSPILSVVGSPLMCSQLLHCWTRHVLCAPHSVPARAPSPPNIQGSVMMAVGVCVIYKKDCIALCSSPFPLSPSLSISLSIYLSVSPSTFLSRSLASTSFPCPSSELSASHGKSRWSVLGPPIHRLQSHSGPAQKATLIPKPGLRSTRKGDLVQRFLRHSLRCTSPSLSALSLSLWLRRLACKLNGSHLASRCECGVNDEQAIERSE